MLASLFGSEAMAWRFVVPGDPPSVNHTYRYHYGRVSKDAAVATYQMVVANAVRNARPKDWSPPEQIRIRYWMRVHGRIDADNALKALNDAIAHGLGVNDACFLPCVMEKSTGNRHPYVEVEIDASPCAS